MSTSIMDADSQLRRFSVAVAGGFFSAIWGVRVTGLEHVPCSGPLLIACNHVSNVDAPLLCVAVSPARRPRFMGKKELFDMPVIGWFFRETGNFALDRQGDVRAMREALATLERGGSLAVFPEGTRVPSGESRTPKAGIGFLAARSGAPVTPARVIGTGAFPGVFPLEVHFGPPLAPPASDDRPTALAYARRVMDAIRAL